MLIAGGLYREICLRPAWNGLFGSGGRAALAIVGQSDSPVLHSYFEDADNTDLAIYCDHGIKLDLSPRQSGIAFAYFHPLSKPHLEQSDLTKCQPLQVHGDVVLRFGFVEGDAIVSARRATFDPQGWRDPLGFCANGSFAEELALVLNETELSRMEADLSVNEAARKLIRSGQANVVVIKRGVFGATVLDQTLKSYAIPAFKSQRVFKIGTGDVFSALFSLYWGEHGRSPAHAAYEASKGVAHYAATQLLPVETATCEYRAVNSKLIGSINVFGPANTIGRYYTFEEAVFRLRELGADVQAHFDVGDDRRPSAMLILADGMGEEMVKSVLERQRGLPVVILDETRDHHCIGLGGNVTVTADFATALYHACWAAMKLEATR
ncbi:hypothetical protein WNZ14_09430 [Hoeflea sp. AS60]|uniref:hypothetical protein n=1 Tax=Hoeflea sp. AS60 TaxID=3135780 RepID=UPI0031779069